MKILNITNLNTTVKRYKNLSFGSTNKNNNNQGVIEKFLAIPVDVDNIGSKEDLDRNLSNYSVSILNKNGKTKDYEFYYTDQYAQQYPCNGLLITEKKPNSVERLYLSVYDQKPVAYEGYRRKRNENGEIEEETCFINGYASSSIKYSKNKVYERQMYDNTTHKKVYVKKLDNTLMLTQSTDKTGKKVEMEITNPDNGEKFRIYFNAANKPGNETIGKYEISSFEDYSRGSIRTKFPSLDFSVDCDENELALLKNALTIMQRVIQKDEYKDDFYKDSNFNYQLDKAIKYLNCDKH